MAEASLASARPCLTGPERTEVLSIVGLHLPGWAVRVFGSRARGTGVKRWSDLDLAIMGPEAPSFEQMSALKAAFSDSNLPYRVDVVAWADAPPALRAAIAAESVELGG